MLRCAVTCYRTSQRARAGAAAPRVDVERATPSGVTAAALARRNAHGAVVELLRAGGARDAPPGAPCAPLSPSPAKAGRKAAAV